MLPDTKLRCKQVTFGGEILSHTDAPPVKKTSRALTYGPYENIGTSFANFWIKFHAVNNAPFAAAKSVHREIEVSHWGNIYVEERYIVVWSTAFSLPDADDGPGVDPASVNQSLT